MVYAAHEWTFWIGVILAIGSVLVVIALFIGYLVKVVRPQYPPNPDR
jgi:hypothetical protein